MGIPDNGVKDIHYIEEHVHNVAAVYPTLAAGVTVTSAETAWVEGDYAEIIPASTGVTSEYDIHWINLEAESSSGGAIYELSLYAATTEIARVRFATIDVPATTIFHSFPVMTPVEPAGTQIQAKLASSTTDADTLTISLSYHTY